jgi:putative tricarboxylic transport membrane protein
LPDILHNLAYGFSIVMAPMNLLYCFLGVAVGTLIGVLPGLGPAATIALLLPSTFHIPPVSAIIMLAGIYYGGMYGGSTTSILVNIPGEAASVVTCLDGYQMARKGRAGPALGISALGSFIGGTLSIIGLIFLAPPLASMALDFGPPEYLSLMLLGLVLLTFLASGSMVKALVMAAFGFFLGSIGLDIVTSHARFSFGSNTLMDGVGLIPVVMGLFGVAEVIENIEKKPDRQVFDTKIRGLLPNRQDWRDSLGPIARGSLIGFLLGVLPGGGVIISSFASYAVEKKVSRNPENFGKGAIQGVAGPETANNAATGGAFVPLLTLGIPSNPVMALLLAALMIHGVQPGPLPIQQAPELFWGVVASMYVGNIMLLVLNLPLIGLSVKILKIPYVTLFPLILVFCLIGAYSLNSNPYDMLTMVVFGVIGYFMRKYGYEAAPLVLAFVLGPMFESALRQSLLMSHGSMIIFFERPISAALMGTATLLLVLPLFMRRRPAKTLRVQGEI